MCSNVKSRGRHRPTRLPSRLPAGYVPRIRRACERYQALRSSTGRVAQRPHRASMGGLGPMHVLPRATAYVAVVAAAGIVAACSSSGSAKSDNTGATAPATTSAAPSSTASTTAAGTLAKADFVSKANALCASTYPKLHPGPAPTSATDYVATVKYT